MSKPLKVLSTAALASVFAASALVPTAVVEAAEPQETVAAKTIENVIFKTKDGQLAYISLDLYMKAHSTIITEGPTYIKGDNEVYYDLEDYMKAFSAGKDLEKTLAILHSKDKGLAIDKVVEGKITDKEVVAKDEQPEDRLNETFFYNVA